MASHESLADPAFEAIEATILPALSFSLDTLIETAAMADPGRDADLQAEALRGLALQLEYLLGQVEAAAAAAIPGERYESVAWAAMIEA
jgi:hypothetical protein